MTQQAIRAFATATSAGAACDEPGSGFRLFIGDGDFSRQACAANYDKEFERPCAAHDVTVGTMSPSDGQELVHVTVDDSQQVFSMVHQYGTEKINSIGLRDGVGPPPPPLDAYES